MADPCFGIYRAFQHPSVCIGWRPYRAVRETQIRTQPGAGQLVKVVPKGGGIAVQSARNPERSAEPPTRLPHVRNDGKEFVWCYSRAGTLQGWVAKEDIEYHQDLTKPPLDGPAGYDFEIGRPREDGGWGPREKKPNGCGKISLTKPLRKVIADETYLRLSGRGTAFHYLEKGDIVKLYIVDGPAGFAFCEVVSAFPGSSAKRGTRGWILQESLGKI